ncbi:lecithin retinol acyltransferase family protein [Pseudomonas mandelii]|uniref:LRAT domain-containing protein n=1 Tax=Pseudomonas mandelii TaxID=75612 RepID=A0A502I9Y2_9PSED|nr:lecithin retinol acyltransferase family protein [Pseudomonas mandelii]TPG83737.1 hypothetical protein EAH74_12600 [Pseudomonas mandelii]
MPTLPAGSHLIVGRGLYTHHGIYVGQDHVIHYSGNLRRFGARYLPGIRIGACREEAQRGSKAALSLPLFTCLP